MKHRLANSLYAAHPEELSEAQLREVSKLPGRYGINILRDHELARVINKEESPERTPCPVAGLWTGWTQNQFTFDVVVDYSARHTGTAKYLVEYAIQQFNEDCVGHHHPILCVAVVNPAMEQLLREHFGFHYSLKNGNHSTMICPQNEDGSISLPQDKPGFSLE
jgi:GNAT superfamily N-acetyltransferase